MEATNSSNLQAKMDPSETIENTVTMVDVLKDEQGKFSNPIVSTYLVLQKKLKIFSDLLSDCFIFDVSLKFKAGNESLKTFYIKF